jgi:ABC-2 type transport system ATP-binding protein
MTTAISFNGVVKKFGAQVAVDGLNFDVEEGSVVSLLGPNGAGKTTSISMMLGLIRPTAGTVELLGKDPASAANRRHIGAMLQQVGLPSQTTVRETVSLFRGFYDDPLPLEHLLEMADLQDVAKMQSDKLSGGQKRRLQFALAMAGNPKVLFLDEPTTAMDVQSRRTFWAQLRAFAELHRRTILLTTHHLEEADSISDRIIIMHRGRKIADGTPAELKQRAGNRFVSFIAGDDVAESDIRHLPSVSDVEWSGRHARVRTNDSDGFLRALIQSGLAVSDFEVSSGALEDAFITLTEAEREVVGQ